MAHMNLIIKGKHKKTLIFPVLSGELVFYLDYSIAIPENNAIKTVQQSAKDKEGISRRADARQRYLTQDFTL